MSLKMKEVDVAPWWFGWAGEAGRGCLGYDDVTKTPRNLTGTLFQHFFHIFAIGGSRYIPRSFRRLGKV